jgi:epoxyqueuosine reductase
LASKIKIFGKNMGFDDVGITSVDGVLPFVDQVFKAYQDGRFGPLDYLARTLDVRLNVRAAFSSASSVVVVVKNYYTGDHGLNSQSKIKIARYAWGKDYHQWFKKKLRSFKPFLENTVGSPIQFWQFNDTGPFLERSWAKKAGLGFIGKSSMFIHRKFGTWTLLGGFATDLIISPDLPYSGPDCGSCTKCMEACPTSAIVAPYTVDASKCISTWTIERPLHEMAIKYAPRNHNWGFGCDICQEACPWNKFQQPTTEERFKPIEGRMFLTKETMEQDLRGSPLHRSSKSGLLVNYLRIKNSLQAKGLKNF